jgi:hypothetical protein
LVDVIVYLLSVLEVGRGALVADVGAEARTAFDACFGEHTSKLLAGRTSERDAASDFLFAWSLAD